MAAQVQVVALRARLVTSLSWAVDAQPEATFRYGAEQTAAVVMEHLLTAEGQDVRGIALEPMASVDDQSDLKLSVPMPLAAGYRLCHRHFQRRRKLCAGPAAFD